MKKKLTCILIGGWGFSKKCLHDCIPLTFLQEKFSTSCHYVHWATLLKLPHRKQISYWDNLTKDRYCLAVTWSMGTFLILDILQKMSQEQLENQRKKMVGLCLLCPATSFVKDKDNRENTSAEALKIMRLRYEKKSTRTMVWENFYSKCHHPLEVQKVPRPVGTTKQLLAGLDYLEKFQMTKMLSTLLADKTLALYGENDSILPKTASQFFAKKMQVKLHKIAAGHAFPLTHPNAVKKALLDFIQTKI